MVIRPQPCMPMRTLPPFQHAIPPGSKVNHIPKGNLVCIFTKCPFSHSATISLPAAALFSCSRLRDTRGGRVCTVRKWRPRPDSVARALGVRSRAIWQVITGSRSAEPEPRWKTYISALLHVLLHCCSATQPQCNTRFKLSLLLQPRTLLTRVWTLHMRVCCVCVCASMRGSVHVCAGTWKSFLWCGFSVLVFTRRCKHRLIFTFIRQRSLYFRQLPQTDSEAHRQFEHE